MKKILSLATLALLFSVASFAQVLPISGPSTGCVGDVTNLFDSSMSSSTGYWSSSNPSVATIGSLSGDVMGVSAGITIITYTDGVGLATLSFTVNPAPPSITGLSAFCVGISTTYMDATPGGVWSITGMGGMATVVPSTGYTTATAPGLVYIYYTLPSTGCAAAAAFSVTSTFVDTVLGPSSVCPGSSITLTNSVTGGTWSTSNPSVATVSSTGVVTGVAAGTAMISYTVSGICGLASNAKMVTVTSTTSAGVISMTGAATLTAGTSTPMYETVGGGTWSTSSTAVATINPATGLLTGVAAGTVTVSYTVTGCSGTAVATFTVTILAPNMISGNILTTGTPCYDAIKVWLITYDAATLDLEAIDSTLVYGTGSTAYYQFTGMPTDNYRVKAAVDTLSVSTGYMPTYHTSSAYWSAATVIAHTAGTADINKDITMGFGTVTSGPGFIAGNVTLGANKGTSGTVPAVGLLIYVRNSTTGSIIKKTVTDAAGHYSFSNLPLGTYNVYPELINYATTPFNGITLTAAAPSANAASFVEHTISKKISPVGTFTNDLDANVSSVTTFPNPSNGKLNINWNMAQNEVANISVTDITGREVYQSTINMTEGTGNSRIDISALTSGLYMINVRSASLNYKNKVQLAH